MTWVPVRRQSAGRVLKLCRCCKQWFDWRTARFVGFQQDGVERLELRNCECGSTAALVVAVAQPADAEARAA